MSKYGSTAAGYWVLHGTGLGDFGGAFSGTFAEYVYLSAVSYTSPGLGDGRPAGVLRPLTGLEALNGLILIAWSASLTLLSMERFWEDHPTRRSRGRIENDAETGVPG